MIFVVVGMRFALAAPAGVHRVKGRGRHHLGFVVGALAIAGFDDRRLGLLRLIYLGLAALGYVRRHKRQGIV